MNTDIWKIDEIETLYEILNINTCEMHSNIQYLNDAETLSEI